MVAMGCKFLRICHLNNCATGVATQDETLRREYFKGLPEMVINYFTGLAEEVRGYLAELGVEKLTDLIGRTDLLETVEGFTAKQSKLDLSDILEAPVSPMGHQLFWSEPNKPFDGAELNQHIVTDALQAVIDRTSLNLYYDVKNTDRSIGASYLER